MSRYNELVTKHDHNFLSRYCHALFLDEIDSLELSICCWVWHTRFGTVILSPSAHLSDVNLANIEFEQLSLK